MSFARFSNRSGGDSFSRYSQPQDPYDTTKLETQISNANTRIQDAGFKAQDGDTRNWFEKLTNLPQSQNGFFDTLEILGRPGNAIKNVLDKSTGYQKSQSHLKSFIEGISGRQKVTGAEIIEHNGGIDNKFARFTAGTLLDIGLDPITYVPGGILAKGITVPAKLVGKVAKSAYQGVEKAIPSFARFTQNTIKPAIEATKDGLGNMFKFQHGYENTLTGGKDDFLKDLANQTDNTISFQTEEATKRIAGDAAKVGFELGDDISRVRESALQINKDPEELLRTIIQGKSPQFNLAEGGHKEFVDKINERILNSGIVTKRVREKSGHLDKVKAGLTGLDDEFIKLADKTKQEVAAKLAKINEKFELRDLFDKRRYEPHNLTKQEIQAINRIMRYGEQKGERLKNLRIRKDAKLARLTKAQGVLETDIAQTSKGIHFNPLETASQVEKGQGFELLNPKQRLYKKAIGNQAKLLDEIAPKGNFDTVIKVEHQAELRPLVEKLLREGKVSAPIAMKGTPALAELRRVFGQDLKVLHKKDTTLSLRQGDADQMYFKLEGSERPVIPETLTARDKIVPESGLKFDDIQFTDRGKPVNVPRPERELSDSPEVHEAANRIYESNNAISQIAKANGIEIPEMEGYITHVLTEEARNYKRMNKAQGGNFGMGQPNKGVVKERKYDGSIEDINELVDRPLFNPNAFIASAIGQKRLIEYIHAETFKNKVLNNRNFALPFKKGMTVPDNAVVINPDSFKFFKIDTPDGSQQMSMMKGKEFLVTKGAKKALDRYQKATTDEGINAFTKAFDTVQSLWKRGALFSLGYHFRNQTGAMFNNSIAGMNAIDLANYTKQGLAEVSRSIKGKESALFTEYRKQGLGSSSLSAIEYARPGIEPEKAIAETIKNMSKSTGQKVSDRINPLNKSAWGNAFKTSTEVGSFFDQANRFALFKWAIEKKGMSVEQAAKKVREVQFDYSKITDFEKNVAVRAIPFYRWMKNNIPYQIKSFVNDPRKYTYLNKARLNAQEVVGLDEDNIPDYMKQNFMMPLHGADGKGDFLSLGLPLADLTKLFRPGKTIVDSVSPLLKTPAELATNFNAFRGKAIQKFEGQEQQYQIPYTDVAFGVPIKAAYAFDAATGQLGRGLSGMLQKEEDKDDVNRLPSLGISSIMKPFDAEKYEYYAKLDELKQMQDLMLFIEQQTGDKPKTISEIKKAAK